VSGSWGQGATPAGHQGQGGPEHAPGGSTGSAGQH
jgi:hypothetical protein